MKQVYDFLNRLNQNNNREWFEAHKSEYLQVQATFNKFVEELIVEVSKWDSQISPDYLKVKDCTYRIYRDVRFSKNKLPYKTHMGAFICKGGKKSPYSGYYFHLEPRLDKQYLGENLLFVGLHCPEPKIVKSIRDEISVNGDSFINAIKKAKGYRVTTVEPIKDNVLKRVPKGYENVKPEWQELIKYKNFSLDKELSKEFVFAPNLAQRVSAEFMKAHEFSQVLNLAVQYALEEM